MPILVHMSAILPLMASTFSRGDEHFHILLSYLLQYSIAVIATICKKLVP